MNVTMQYKKTIKKLNLVEKMISLKGDRFESEGIMNAYVRLISNTKLF